MRLILKRQRQIFIPRNRYQALADVLAYAKDEEKTNENFVEGINCNVAIARDQFITVKEAVSERRTVSKPITDI